MRPVFPWPMPAFPLVSLACVLRDACKLRYFVETGTYRGDTAREMAEYFERVYTVEGVSERYQAGNDFDWPQNVERYCGDSALILGDVMKQVPGPALVWLDAHWICCGSPTPEADPYQTDVSACPLEDELKQLKHGPHAILIDDAHYFLSPPRLRGNPDAWPSIDRICELLPGKYIVMHSGILIVVSYRYREAVRDWCLSNKDLGPRQK